MPESIPSELVIRGRRIAQDENGFLSLTDMWVLAGSDDSKKPKNWRRLPTTKELTEALMEKGRFSPLLAKIPDNSVIYSRLGRNGGTFAHVILALAFAEYLDAQLGIEVREIALRFWAGDITLLDEFVQRRHEQAREDNGRVVTREEIRDHNSHLQFSVLRGLGAKSPAQYAEFHNSGYRGLYNGEDENAIHRRKKLGPAQQILDHMGVDELAANLFRTSQARRRLERFPASDLAEANRTHTFVGKRVREFIAEMDTGMPEDMPTADSIAKAKKRLRNHDKVQKKIS